MNAAVFTNTITIPKIKHPNPRNRKCKIDKSSLPFCHSVSVVLNPINLSLEEEIPPNALRRKLDSSWRGGFSLGVDLGFTRTGLALSKGFSIRPLSVCVLIYPIFSYESFLCMQFFNFSNDV